MFALHHVGYHVGAIKESTEDHKIEAESVLNSLDSTVHSTAHQHMTTLISHLDNLSVSLDSIISLSSTRRANGHPSSSCSKVREVLLSYQTALTHVESILSHIDVIGVTGISSVDTFVSKSQEAFETKLSTLKSHQLSLESSHESCFSTTTATTPFSVLTSGQPVLTTTTYTTKTTATPVTISLPVVFDVATDMKNSTAEQKSAMETILETLDNTTEIHKEITDIVTILDDLTIALDNIISLVGMRKRRSVSSNCENVENLISLYAIAIADLETILDKLDSIGITGIQQVDILFQLH